VRRINGEDESGEETMGKKKTNITVDVPGNTGIQSETVVKNGEARRVHRVVELDATATTPATTTEAVADDVPVAETAAETTDEAAPESGNDAAPPSTPPVDKAKFAWLKRLNAGRALKHAIEQLSRHDYSEWDIDGITAALGLLKHASTKMDALNKKPSKGAKVEVGAVVRIRDKFAAHYDGIVDGDDRTGIKVIGTNDKTARAELRSGEKVALPIAHIEVAS
jgi:hypothetical protein